jgi:hypothetical protein
MFRTIVALVAVAVFSASTPSLAFMLGKFQPIAAARVPADVLRVYHQKLLVRGIVAYQACGGSGFYGIIEYRTPGKWIYGRATMDEADKLNGVSAVDQYSLNYRFSRSYDSTTKTWSPWVDLNYAGQAPFYVMRQTINGVVKYDSSNSCHAPSSPPG